ncbi:MAG: hypothetical protein ACPGWS_01410 [Solirubrobacterales bacterium]
MPAEQSNLPGVPAGYEAVRFDFPKKGERILNEMGNVTTAVKDYTQIRHLIVREIWQYPTEWLGGAGVVRNGYGEWLVSESRLELIGSGKGNEGWDLLGKKLCLLTPELFPQWQPPECDDWRESWRPNPNFEGGEGDE